jgi:hypothetical protein
MLNDEIVGLEQLPSEDHLPMQRQAFGFEGNGIEQSMVINDSQLSMRFEQLDQVWKVVGCMGQGSHMGNVRNPKRADLLRQRLTMIDNVMCLYPTIAVS